MSEGIDWGDTIKYGFTCVSRTFLRNYKALGITAMEAMVTIQILDYQWKRKIKPFPKVKTICDMMGLSTNTVRKHVRALRSKGFLATKQRRRSNEYDFEPLFEILKVLIENTDEAKERVFGRKPTPKTQFAVEVDALDNEHEQTRQVEQDYPKTGYPQIGYPIEVEEGYKQEQEQELVLLPGATEGNGAPAGTPVEAAREQVQHPPSPPSLSSEDPERTASPPESDADWGVWVADDKPEPLPPSLSSEGSPMLRLRVLLDRALTDDLTLRRETAEQRRKREHKNARRVHRILCSPPETFNVYDLETLFLVYWSRGWNIRPSAWKGKERCLMRKLLNTYGGSDVAKVVKGAMSSWHKVVEALGLRYDSMPSVGIFSGFQNTLFPYILEPAAPSLTDGQYNKEQADKESALGW